MSPDITRIHALAGLIVGERTNAELYGSLGAAAMLDDVLWINDLVAGLRGIDADTPRDAFLGVRSTAIGLAEAASDLPVGEAGEIARLAREAAEILGRMAGEPSR